MNRSETIPPEVAVFGPRRSPNSSRSQVRLSFGESNQESGLIRGSGSGRGRRGTSGRPTEVRRIPRSEGVARGCTDVVPVHVLEKPDKVCADCNALKFEDETKGMCCQNGKVVLAPLQPPPAALKNLFFNRRFLKKIRAYNQCFAFTSFGAKIVDFNRGPPSFKIQGQVTHRIGFRHKLTCRFPFTTTRECTYLLSTLFF